MKKIFLLMILQMTVYVVIAQQPTLLNHQKDKKEIGGLTVHLRAAPGNTYLFDLLQGPIPLENGLRNNPATMLPKGFATREDAFKVAEWMIKQYKKHGHMPAIVPPHVLDELKIEKKSLYRDN